MPAPEGFEAYPFVASLTCLSGALSVRRNGGTTTGRTLYDLMHVKTAGASGQSATVGDDMVDALGIPKDSVGLYKFTNPGNSSTTCVFTMWWEEIVA